MARYAMVTDLRKCVGCHACTVACNAEWDVPPAQARTHVHVDAARRHVSRSSHRAPTSRSATTATARRASSRARRARRASGDDGIVRVDKRVCIGCGFCVEACPYEARHIARPTKKVDKCDFCVPRIERGEEPACVATCTAHAKYFGDLEDRGSDVYRMVYEDGARRIETATVAVGPNVYYPGRPEHLDLVAASFPPRAAAAAGGRPGLEAASFKPLMLAAVGATFVGQAVAFFDQLRKGEKDFED